MTGFKLCVVGMFGWYVLDVFSQIQDLGAFSSWLQYGALGLLGITVLGQLYIIVVSLRDVFNRMDQWEKQRHEDHEELNETMAKLRENCAIANASRFGMGIRSEKQE